MNFPTRLALAAIAAALLAATPADAFVPSPSLSPPSCRGGPLHLPGATRSAMRNASSRLQQSSDTAASVDVNVNGKRDVASSSPLFRKLGNLIVATSGKASGGNNRKMLKQNAFVFLAGLCLSFNSGYINGCCLSGALKSCGTGVGVSAFTGAYTQAGLALGGGNVAVFASHMKMILSFVAGSCLSGLINPRPVPNRVSPRYGPTFLVGSVLLAASSLLANTRPEGRAFLYLAAMANGLQNAVSSAYTANLIRSSHMSGITSDIGMILGQMLGGNMANAWRAVVLSGLASSFLLGGIASYGAVTKFKSLALVFNAVLFFCIAVGTIAWTSYQEHVSLWRAASGQWDWGEQGPPAEEYVMELFQRHDTDGNGYLDEDEFATVVKEVGIKNTSDYGIRAVFRSVDVDGDGGVTQDELLGMVNCGIGPNGEEECQLVFPEDEEEVDASKP